MKQLVVGIGILSILLTGCARYASERNLDSITINMPKDDAIRKMKGKGVARGAVVNKFGQLIEVREYQVDRGKSAADIAGISICTVCTLGLTTPLFFSEGQIDTYWLYFCDGRLAQWGRAGDWAEAQRMIYDINFNVSTS